MSNMITELDQFSIVLEKLECLLSLALTDGETQGKNMFLILVMVEDYVHELRQIATHLSEREVCR